MKGWHYDLWLVADYPINDRKNLVVSEAEVVEGEIRRMKIEFRSIEVEKASTLANIQNIDVAEKDCLLTNSD